MSWLTDITSKAESFLNQIDQSAAHTLQHEGQTSHIGEIEVRPEYAKVTPPISPINTTFNGYDYKHPSAANINRSAEAKLSSCMFLYCGFLFYSTFDCSDLMFSGPLDMYTRPFF